MVGLASSLRGASYYGGGLYSPWLDTIVSTCMAATSLNHVPSRPDHHPRLP